MSRMETSSFTHSTGPGAITATSCHLAHRKAVKRPFTSHAKPQRFVTLEHVSKTTRHSARNQRLSTCAALPESTEVVIVGAGKHQMAKTCRFVTEY